MKNKNDMQKKIESTLDIKAKLNQKTVASAIRSIDWGTTSNSPLVVEFDPTTACNLACPDCINRDLLNQGLFTRERIRKLVEEMVKAGVKAVILIGGGEPLMHPEIGWVIQYLGENGIQLGITTNGLLIPKYLDLIARYASWVRISVDAGTAETYKKIRPSISGKSEFENILSNMRMLSKVKKGKLGYSFMIYSSGMFQNGATISEIPLQLAFQTEKRPEVFSNIQEIFKAAQLAKDVGCDYCEVKPMYNADHYLILQDKELMEVAKEQLEKAKNLNTNQFKVLFATKLHNLLEGEESLEIKNYSRCAVAQLRTLVTPSGVYVCPYFRGRGDKRIGDVMKSSFSEMWHGEQRKKILADLNPIRDCRMHCIRHESNLILEEIIAGKRTFDIIDDFDLFI